MQKRLTIKSCNQKLSNIIIKGGHLNNIYKKTLKGVEETALLGKGLALRLCTYLLMVDGIKSVDEIISQHKALP